MIIQSNNVLSGTVLSGHPLLSGQFLSPENYFPLCTVISTSIKRSLSPFAKSQRDFFYSLDLY